MRTRRILVALAVVALAAGALAGATVAAAGADGVSASSRTGAHAAAGRGIWRPGPRTTWQWQLTGAFKRVAAQMYDLDLYDTPASRVAALHQAGSHVICYLDAGTFENYRPDVRRFPAAVLGRPNGWPGERWLDIRALALLAPIMRTRMALCRAKGFDGVEADNVDGYTNDTGFPLTGAEQLTYNRFLAATAHKLGLSIALKNDVDQTRQLAPVFDYALDEQCFQYSECGTLAPFVQAHKAVFEVEYNLSTSRFCASARRDGFMSMQKDINLTATRQPCW